MDESLQHGARPNAWRRMEQAPKHTGARKLAALLLLVVLAAACGFIYQAANGRLVQHQYFEVSQETSFATWTLPLPFRYRLVGTKSVSDSDHGSIRLLRPDQSPTQ